jgi:hypothetical protein
LSPNQHARPTGQIAAAPPSTVYTNFHAATSRIFISADITEISETKITDEIDVLSDDKSAAIA